MLIFGGQYTTHCPQVYRIFTVSERRDARQMRQLPARLQAALTLFEKAITPDASYYGGYAGPTQAAAMFGGLAPPGPTRDEMPRQP